MRLIDADKLKEAIEPYRYAICGFEGVLALIDNAPTVEYTFEEAFQKTVCEQRLYCPKRPQGEWIKHYDSSDGFTWLTCSRCMFKAYEDDYNFCPNCGAGMGKEKK